MKMKSFLTLILLFVIGGTAAFGQQNNSELYQRAQKFIQNKDYNNAVLLLKRATDLHPGDYQSRQLLAYTYTLTGAYKEAEKEIREVLKSDEVNEQSFQIAGNIYLAQDKLKQARRNYENGLKIFPRSGVLYSELGQVYYSEQDYTKALRNWTEGIKVEPDYSANYYFAARAYYYSGDQFWALIYGEIFVNLESFTNRTSEVKNILLDTYREMIKESFSVALRAEDEGFSTVNQTDFRKAVMLTLGNSADMSLNQGVTPETLVMTRMQFLLRWNKFYNLVYPFTLFDLQKRLIKEGLFDAYNQWIFGPASNANLYKGWVKRNPEVMNRLIDFLHDKTLTPQADQFYQEGKIEFVPAPLDRGK